jgi:hypothetical protein
MIYVHRTSFVFWVFRMYERFDRRRSQEQTLPLLADERLGEDSLQSPTAWHEDLKQAAPVKNLFSEPEMESLEL